MKGVSDELQQMLRGGDPVDEHLGKYGKHYAVLVAGMVIMFVIIFLIIAVVLMIVYKCPDDSDASEFAGGRGRVINNKIDPGRMKVLETENALDAAYGTADLLNPKCARKQLVDFRNMDLDNFEEPEDFMYFTGGCDLSQPAEARTGSPRVVKAPVLRESPFYNQSIDAVNKNLLYGN